MDNKTDLSRMIADVLAIAPDAPALEYERVWSSWGDLAGGAERVVALLADHGVREGARVAVLLRNHPALVQTMLGLFTSARCLATINASAPDDKLARDLIAVQAPVIVALPADWDRPGMIEAGRASGALCIRAGDALEVLFAGDPATAEKPSAPGIAIEMLSSGTTGEPKRIPLAERNFTKALLAAASYEKGRGQDQKPRLRGGVSIVTAPMAHIAGITGVMNNLLAGRKVCLIDRFTVEGFRDAVSRHKPRVAGAPPSALRMILDADVPREDLASLAAFRTGTAPLDPDLADAFYDKYGIPVLQNYGATEFAGGAAGWTLDDFKQHWKAKRGSVGRMNPGAQGRTVDPETGAPLPAGQTGLFEVRAANIGNGKDWVRTTDLAIVDVDNFLFIKGRADNAIIRGGFKILPDDVIKTLEQHPAVREAAVVGLPDPRLGAVPAAAYVARAGVTPPEEAAMKAWLKERLMPYQVPVFIKVLGELPRTPSMKVSLPQLKAIFGHADG